MMPARSTPLMLAAAGDPAAEQADARSRRVSRRYAHVAFFTCLCLQRFGVHLGLSALSISVPVIFGLAGVMLLTGRARISTSIAGRYMAFGVWAVLSTWAATLWPDPRAGYSLPSLLNILLLYATIAVRPTRSFDGAAVLRIFLVYARVIAALGILEFLLQFIGIRVFSFTEIIPRLDPLLLERDYAFNALLSYGSVLRRSNGMLLLEPSVFSQLLAMAIIIDFLILGRMKYLPLYCVAYMTSFSGTGLISLAAPLAVYGLSSGTNLKRVIIFGVAASVVVGVFALLLPEQIDAFFGRASELGESGSSGSARFLAQFLELRAFGGEARSWLGFGPGAALGSPLFVPGSGNPFLILFVDYGVIGTILFLVFLFPAIWSRRLPAISLALIVTFQFGGGNLVFAPFVLLLSTLAIWGCAEAPDAPQDAPFPDAAERLRLQGH